MYNVTLRRVHGIPVCVCVRACVWVHVRVYVFSMELACAILSAASLAPPYFSTLSHKRLDFSRKVI